MFKEKTNNLFVVAHTDDELFGIGGTILKLNELKNNNYLIICSDSDKIDPNDLKCLLDQLKIKLIYFNCNDKPFKINIQTLSEEIKNILTYYNDQDIFFNNIFTHYKYDFNTDHQKIFETTYLAFRPHQYKCNLFSFETYDSSNSYYSKFNPNLFINISEDHLSKKLDLLNKYYKSELKNGRDLEGIKNHMRRWGSLNNSKYCEAFETVRILI
jgi:LmbE family N-acetylglucosaminyl deacetylase